MEIIAHFLIKSTIVNLYIKFWNQLTGSSNWLRSLVFCLLVRLLIQIWRIVKLRMSMLMMGIETVWVSSRSYDVVGVRVIRNSHIRLFSRVVATDSVCIGLIISQGKVKLLLLDLLVSVIEFSDLVMVIVQLQVVIFLERDWLAGSSCSGWVSCCVGTLTDAIKWAHCCIGRVFSHYPQLRWITLSPLDLGPTAVHSDGVS